jgi:hypothetical protein
MSTGHDRSRAYGSELKLRYTCNDMEDEARLYWLITRFAPLEHCPDTFSEDRSGAQNCMFVRLRPSIDAAPMAVVHW